MNEDTYLKNKSASEIAFSFSIFRSSLNYSDAPMWCQFMIAYSILAINVIFSYFAISLLLLDEIYSELCLNVYLIFVNVHLTNEFFIVYMLMTSHKAILGYGTEGKFYWNKWNT